MHISLMLALASSAFAIYEPDEIIPSKHRVCNPNELGLEDYTGFVVHHQVVVSSWPNLHYTRISECQNQLHFQHDQYHPNGPDQDTLWGKKLCSVHNHDDTRCFMMARRRRYAGLKYSLFVPNMWIGTLFECDWRNPKDPECRDPVPLRPLIADNLVLANWYETPDGFKHMVRQIPMFYTTNQFHPVPEGWHTTVDPHERYTYNTNEAGMFHNVATNLQSWFHTLNRLGQQEPLDIDVGDGRPRRQLSAPIDWSYKTAFLCEDDDGKEQRKCPAPPWKDQLDLNRRTKPDYHGREGFFNPPPVEQPRNPNDFDDPLGLMPKIPSWVGQGASEETKEAVSDDPFYDPVFEREREEFHRNGGFAAPLPVKTGVPHKTKMGPPPSPLKHSFSLFSSLFGPRAVAKKPEPEPETWGFFDVFQPKPRQGQTSTGLADKILYGHLHPTARPGGGGPASYTGGYRTFDSKAGGLVPVVRPTARRPAEFDFTPFPMLEWISAFSDSQTATSASPTGDTLSTASNPTSTIPHSTTTSVTATSTPPATTAFVSNDTMPKANVNKAKRRVSALQKQKYEKIEDNFDFEELPINPGYERTRYSSYIEHNKKVFARKEQRQKDIAEMKIRAKQKRDDVDDLDKSIFFLDEPVSVGEGPIFYSVPATDLTANVTVPLADDLQSPVILQKRSLSSRLDVSLTDMIDTFESIGEKKYRQLMQNILSALDSVEDS
ncbi:hypothetical protein CJU89_0446 [Yarrowia sp. B02]|nr:hypothetical protein CJU89_0446 [Yarrowia sp. B02]